MEREGRESRSFSIIAGILATSLFLALVLFLIHHQLLTDQVKERLRAETTQRALSARLLTLQDAERRRFARELHDSVGQSLGAIKYSLERAAELQRLRKHDDAHPLLTRTVSRVKQTMREIHAIGMDLRPSILDDLGVASALAWLCLTPADVLVLSFELPAAALQAAADTAR